MNILKQDYKERIIPEMMKSRGYVNIQQVPKISKVVINSSVGSSGDIKNALEDAEQELTRISGQKPIRTRAKKEYFEL
jgi:large subunit ribosomal protein L5